MPTYSAQEIIERAKSAADMRDNFVTTQEWLRWLVVEQMMLEVFIARNGIILRESREDISADGSSAYLINDPLCIIGVFEVNTSNGQYRRLKAGDVIDGPGHMNSLQTGRAEYYSVVQAPGGQVSLRMWPIPTSGLYQVFMVDIPSNIESLADQLTYPMGWEERIVLGMARRALAKEESPTVEIARQISEIERHIETSAWDRLFAANQTVRNVDAVERGWSRYPQFPDPASWYWI